MASNNSTLIALAARQYQSPDATGSVLLTFAANQFGQAVITVTVTDGGLDNDLNTSDGNGTLQRSFTVTVNPLNDPPTLDPLPALYVLDKNNVTQSIQLTGITAGGGESQPLRVTASTNNAQWIQNLALPYTSPASSATLTFTTNGVTDSGQITITITDGGLDNDLNTVGDNLSLSHVISVVAKNDPPSVALANKVTTLAENLSMVTRHKVADIVVTDDGIGGQTLTLSGADARHFEIADNQLFLSAGVVLDYENKQQYVVIVEVDDPTVGTTPDGTSTLTLNLTDVNEPPSVALANVTASLAENSSIATRLKVADIIVTDDALGTNTLTLAGVHASAFEEFQGGLYLRAGTVLDFETLAQWVVIVQVDDSTLVGTPDGTAMLTLNVTDVNEVPTVALQNVTTSLPENSSTSNRHKVADVVVTDDTLGRPTLTLSGADASRFELSGNELFLRAGAVLDFETKSQYVVIVEVDDPAVGTTPDSTSTLTLNLTDVNEPPSVTLANVTASLLENTNTSARVKVADVVVTDDALGTNSLTLTGTNANRFELFAGGLYLLAGTVLDYETLAQWVVIVQVDDSTIVGSPDGTATLTLNVTDVNEAPTVALQDVTTSLPENSSTSNRRKVADVVVTDDALGRPTLTLSGADAGRFELNGNELFLRAGVVLDFEIKPQYMVVVEVDDPAIGTTPEAAAMLMLNLTDVNEPPSVALANVTASLPENTNTSARVKVADIIVADDALGDEALRLEGSDADDFEIVGQELFLRAGTLLDFEVQNRYGVTIVVDDPTLGNATDGTSDFALAVTNVNERPTELLLSNLRISETTDTSSGPAFVGNVIVVDEDRIGNAYAYALVDVQGATDNDRFQFDGKSLQVRQGVVLSAATQATYLVRVQVSDGPHVLEQAFEIQVTDVNRVPTGIALDPATLPENVETSRSPMLIGTLIAADDTPANRLLFSLASGSGDDDNARFQVAGPLLLLKQGEVVDFETRKQYRVQVSVFDELNRFEQALTITVIDVNEPPTVALANTITSLPENSDTTARRKMADVVVTDDVLGTNTLTLTGTHASRFELVSNELFLRAGTPLDFETLSQLVVIVAVDDPTIGNTPDSTATLTLGITDVNEPPTLTLANTITSLPENSDTSARRKVADVVVTDDAIGTNALTLSGTHASHFELVGNELFVRAGTPLDFETLPQLVVIVAVDDSTIGNTPDSTATLTLGITDVNEPPTLALTDTITTLLENSDTTARRKVAELVVTDDALGIVSFGLSGTDAGMFEIDGTGLFLRAGTVLDFETQPQLTVIVTVDDPAVGVTPDDQAELRITITDVVEGTPDPDEDGVSSAIEDAGPSSGDGNHDGTPDSEQRHVTSVPSPVNGRYVTLAAPVGADLTEVRVEPISTADNAPASIDFLLGRVVFSVPVSEPGGRVMLTLFPESMEGINGYYKFGPTPGHATPHWYPFLYNGTTGAKILTDRIELYFVDGGRGDTDGTANGVIVDPGAPAIDQRPHPWQHPLSPVDVNDDGSVSPLDVLLIVNELNLRGSYDLSSLLVAPNLPPSYFDVSGDAAISPLDALQVINDLNSQGPRVLSMTPSAEGEGGTVTASLLPCGQAVSGESREDGGGNVLRKPTAIRSSLSESRLELVPTIENREAVSLVGPSQDNEGSDEWQELESLLDILAADISVTKAEPPSEV